MIIAFRAKDNAVDLACFKLQQQKRKPTAIYLADNSIDGAGTKIAERYNLAFLSLFSNPAEFINRGMLACVFSVEK
jgi:hypothetical protein